jgi:hypothetical protein
MIYISWESFSLQSYTHFLTGILLAEWVILWHLSSPILETVIIIVLAFLSHFPIDIIVKVTYHPSQPHTQDKFWVGYHIFVAVASIIILIYFWGYWWVMLATSVVDIIDWLILRGILHKKPIFHPFLENIRDKILFWIPKLYEVKWAFLIEFGIDALLIWGIIAL